MGRTRYFYVTLAAAVIVLSGCTGPPKYTSKGRPAADSKPPPATTPGTADTGSPGIKRDRLQSIYAELIGTRYAYGGQSSRGYDCSGLMQRIFWEYDQIRLPRTVGEMFRAGRPVTTSNLRTGDLVFFNTTGRGASHVGMYLWDDMFLHASRSEGVTLTDISDEYWSARFLGARRVLN